MRARLTPRESQGHKRLTDMLETVRLVKGDAFHAVAYMALQARATMARYDRAGGTERIQTARQLMESIREMAQALALRPGQLAEALRHARVMYREGIER